MNYNEKTETFVTEYLNSLPEVEQHQFLNNWNSMKRKRDRAMLGSKHPKSNRLRTDAQAADAFNGLSKMLMLVSKASQGYVTADNDSALALANKYGI